MCKSYRFSQLYSLVRVTLLLSLPLFPATRSSAPSAFRGSAAFAAAQHAVSFGERPSGSEAIGLLRSWIVTQLKPLGGKIVFDRLTGHTPADSVAMTNIILEFPGTSGKKIVVSGHYDTKRIPLIRFVGANDGGSSTGFLIEFARAVSTWKHPDEIDVVFFDGEEAVASWTDADSLYGSRHLAARWAADGTLPRIRALINIDMIGDRNLDLSNDSLSSETLRDETRLIAAKLDYASFFRTGNDGGIEDDHKPFVDSGVNAIDIIDLDYGPGGAYWHTAQDTMDKLSSHSFQVVGDVTLKLVQNLERRK